MTEYRRVGELFDQGATDNLERHYRAEWLRLVRVAGVEQEQLDAALVRMEADQMAP